MMTKDKMLSYTGALFIAIMLIYAVIPSSKNPFDNALEIIVDSKNVNVSTIEVLTANHASVLFTEEVQFKLIIDDTVYFATLTKIPFFNYKVKAMIES